MPNILLLPSAAHHIKFISVSLCFLYVTMMCSFAFGQIEASISGKIPQTGETAGQAFNFSAPVALKLIWCPPGDFLYGQSEEDPYRAPLGIMRRGVIISDGFWIGQYEVTRQQWEEVMTSTPWEKLKIARITNNQLPATGMSWSQSIEFCNRLTELYHEAGCIEDSYVLTLPTEEQWEYATRAGTSTEYSFGDNELNLGEYAWFGGNAELTIGLPVMHPIGTKKPNLWNIYDTHGNAAEWCSTISNNSIKTERLDEFNAPWFRVYRGGSSWSHPFHCRSSFRYATFGTTGEGGVGLRVVLIKSVSRSENLDEKK